MKFRLLVCARCEVLAEVDVWITFKSVLSVSRKKFEAGSCWMQVRTGSRIIYEIFSHVAQLVRNFNSLTSVCFI